MSEFDEKQKRLRALLNAHQVDALSGTLAELMGQRPGSLSAEQAGRDTDAPSGPERGAVTGAAVFPLDCEALPAG